MTIKPLADNVVIKATAAEETTKSGIVLTSASKEKPQIAAKYAGTDIKIEDEEYTVLHISDILAVVE